MPEINPSLASFADGFKPGKYLGLKSYKDNEELFDLFDEFGDSRSVYLRESKDLAPNLVQLIENGIDLRSIFILMITLDQGALAKDFLNCLEDNNIFFNIDKVYHSPRKCPNLFAEVASFGDAEVTKSLFKYGMNGFKFKLKNDLSEKEKKEKINEFAEELFALTPSVDKMSTLEYVMSSITPVGLMNEGFGNGKKDNNFGIQSFAYSELYSSKSEELEISYFFPWKTIKVLTDLGYKYNIDLTASESKHLSIGEKIFGLVIKAADDKDVMLELVKKFIYPYSEAYEQDIELEPYGKNLEKYFFRVDMDGTHYDNNPSDVLIKMSPQEIKAKCEDLLSSVPKMSQQITERLDEQAAALDEAIQRVRRGSELRKEQAALLEEHGSELKAVKEDVKIVKADVEAIKVDLKDLKKASVQLQKIVNDNLADNLIFANIGDNPSLQRLYVGIRDSILKHLNEALKGKDGKRDEQMNLMLKNGSMLAGTLDFAAGFAGIPGVIGGTFGVIAYACKYFEKLHEDAISEEMQKMLLGSLNLPQLIAVGVAESLVLRAKDNVHSKTYKEIEEKHILKIVDDLVSRQLSSPHLNKLFEIMNNPDHRYRKERDIFEELKRIILQTIADGKPYTSVILEEEKALSNSSSLTARIMKTFSPHSKKLKVKNHCVNYHPHDPHGMVHDLFKPTTIISNALPSAVAPSTPPSSYFVGDEIATIHPGKDKIRLAGSGSSDTSSGNKNKHNYKI